MPVQLNIFLLLFGGLQGILFTLFLIRRKLHRTGYIFLLLYFAVLLLQIVLKVMSKGWLINNWWGVYQLSYQLPYLYGPLIFLFAREMTSRKSLHITSLLHSVPFVFAGILLFIPDKSDFTSSLFRFFFQGESGLLFQLLSIAIYHSMAYHYWYRYSRGIRDYYSNVQQLQLSWLKKFILLSAILCAVIAVTIYFMYVFYPALNWLRMGFVALTMFIYWVSYAALTQPDIFSDVKEKERINEQPAERERGILAEIKPKLQVHRPARKYGNSSLPEEEAARIAESLEQLMCDKRPFLDPEITIDKLAVLVSSNRHHLSQVLNQKIGLSFYDYINTYRVNEARILLTDTGLANHKIASIAYDAGFNSLSAFNDVFKKMTGQTPSQYRKQPSENVTRTYRVV
ncbi:MAG TPA: helix-turn-helix domain-containing protein [Chitinophagaceae bacterium]